MRIVFRGDAGFCRQRIINWCERASVHHIVDLARNARLEAQVEYAQLAMKDQYEQAGLKQRLVDEFRYAAQSWPHERRLITRLEWGEQRCNPRFVVTDLLGDAHALYDGVYCQCGEAESRIKEAQVGLFATRTSCHALCSNQLRMLLAALGYVLIERLRALALQGTALALHWPGAEIFAHAMSRLRSP